MRTIGPFAPTDDDGPGYSMWWAVEGRGRRGVTLDLRRPAGQDLFRRLAATADVVCENFRPGAMEAWGIGPDQCDPRLVWARISVFGQDGPYAGRTGLDRMGIAYGGLLHLTGYPDRPPVRPGVTISDYLTGVFAAEGVTAALYRRDGPDGTGRGGVVDAPLYGSILRILEWTLAGQDTPGHHPPAGGQPPPHLRPHGQLPDRRRPLRLRGGRLRRQLPPAVRGDGPARAGRRPQVGHPGQPGGRLRRDQRAGGRVGRHPHRRRGGGAAASPTRCRWPPPTTPPTSWPTPTSPSRGDLVTVDDPVVGPHRQQAPFPRLDGHRPVAPRPAPRLGEHNDEVWGPLVGLTDDELAAYRTDGVI